MDVPVILTIGRELARRGMVALRFNFRGVGRSEGSYGGGVAEVADVAGAVDYLAARSDVDPGRLYLLGYSFGASVALRHVQADPRIAGIVALCLPLGEMSIGSLDEGFWQVDARPKLFLAGDRDHVCPLSELEPLVKRLPEPKRLVVLEGVDHFLWGREQEVANHVVGFLEGLSRSGSESMT